jgi:hypothetical protein
MAKQIEGGEHREKGDFGVQSMGTCDESTQECDIT